MLLAVDQSLTSSGYAYYDENDTMRVGRIMPKTLRGVQRLQFIENAFADLMMKANADVVAMEGYSMGSRGRVFDIGELGGVIKLCAYEMGVPILIVPPMTLKGWVTGKGNADKKKMIAAVKKRWYDDVTSDDVADAIALLHFGQLYVEQKNKRRKSPEIRDFMKKCVWEDTKK